MHGRGSRCRVWIPRRQPSPAVKSSLEGSLHSCNSSASRFPSSSERRDAFARSALSSCSECSAANSPRSRGATAVRARARHCARSSHDPTTIGRGLHETKGRYDPATPAPEDALPRVFLVQGGGRSRGSARRMACPPPACESREQAESMRRCVPVTSGARFKGLSLRKRARGRFCTTLCGYCTLCGHGWWRSVTGCCATRMTRAESSSGRREVARRASVLERSSSDPPRPRLLRGRAIIDLSRTMSARARSATS